MSNRSSPSVNSYDPEDLNAVVPEYQASTFNLAVNARFANSPTLVEKGIDYDKIDQSGKDLIQTEGWRKFVRNPRGRINVSVVREFYSALSTVNACDLSQLITVRGTLIHFSPHIINHIYEIPVYGQIQNLHFEYLWELGDSSNVVNYITEAFQYLFPDFEQNFDSTTSALHAHLRAWKHFINSRVYPTSDFSWVSDSEILLLFALISGAHVDWGVLIFRTACNFAVDRYNSGRPMPFAWLISRLCVNLNEVSEIASDEINPSRDARRGLLPVDNPGCSSTV